MELVPTPTSSPESAAGFRIISPYPPPPLPVLDLLSAGTKPVPLASDSKILRLRDIFRNPTVHKTHARVYYVRDECYAFDKSKGLQYFTLVRILC